MWAKADHKSSHSGSDMANETLVSTAIGTHEETNLACLAVFSAFWGEELVDAGSRTLPAFESTNLQGLARQQMVSVGTDFLKGTWYHWSVSLPPESSLGSQLCTRVPFRPPGSHIEQDGGDAPLDQLARSLKVSGVTRVESEVNIKQHSTTGNLLSILGFASSVPDGTFRTGQRQSDR